MNNYTKEIDTIFLTFSPAEISAIIVSFPSAIASSVAVIVKLPVVEPAGTVIVVGALKSPLSEVPE